jgi:GxxExxY protein
MKPFIKDFLIAPELNQPQMPGRELAQAVIAAAKEAHRHLGPGFAEKIYEEALCSELKEAEIPFERQREIGVLYKNWPIGTHRLQLLVGGALVVKIEAIDAVAEIHKTRMIAWLRASGLPLGLIINFNVPILKNGIQRVMYRDNQATGWNSLRSGVQKL